MLRARPTHVPAVCVSPTAACVTDLLCSRDGQAAHDHSHAASNARLPDAELTSSLKLPCTSLRNVWRLTRFCWTQAQALRHSCSWVARCVLCGSACVCGTAARGEGPAHSVSHSAGAQGDGHLLSDERHSSNILQPQHQQRAQQVMLTALYANTTAQHFTLGSGSLRCQGFQHECWSDPTPQGNLPCV